MTTESRSPSHDGTPCTHGPAPQPHDPCADCKPPDPGPTAPCLPDPKKCETCCECPGGAPPVGPDCLDELIAKEAKIAAKAGRADEFKKYLEALQETTKNALQDYPHDRYKDLLKRWIKLDGDIVSFIKNVVCNVDCWWCVVECEICPLIYTVRDLERKLYGTGSRYHHVDSLLDQQYWWTRERDVRNARLERIKAVMKAWETPRATIDKILTENENFIKDACPGPNNGSLLYDLFFKVIPLHLAIAPPAGVHTTGIEKKYADLCPCDDAGPVDDCCGPNVGVPSLRERVIGSQPFLINPAKYVELVCCLAKYRYYPAKEDLTEADSEVSRLEDLIKRTTDDIAAKTASLPDDAKARLSKPIDCRQYQPKPPKPHPEPRYGGEDDARPTPPAAPTQS